MSGFWDNISDEQKVAFANVTGKLHRESNQRSDMAEFSPFSISTFFIALGDPNQAVFFGSMGIAAALVFANLGSAYGTAKSGVGIVSVAVLKPELLFKSIIPVVMAGVLGMYGMIIAILMKQNRK